MCGCDGKHKKGKGFAPKKKPKTKPRKVPKRRGCVVVAGIHICQRKPGKHHKKRLFIRRRRRAKGWDDDDYLGNMPVRGGLHPKKASDSKYAFLL